MSNDAWRGETGKLFFSHDLTKDVRVLAVMFYRMFDTN